MPTNILLGGSNRLVKRVLASLDLSRITTIVAEENEDIKHKLKSINTRMDYIILCLNNETELLEHQYLIEEANQSFILITKVILDGYESEKKLMKDILNAKKNHENVQIISSGLSYARDAIDQDYFEEGTFFNYAYSSQDLLSDQLILKELIRDTAYPKFKHYILGLGHYSFSYDMSKSVNSYNLFRYYFLDTSLRTYEKFKIIYEKTREFLDSHVILDNLIDTNDYKISILRKNTLAIDKEKGEKVAKAHKSKYYPVTIEQNKEILKDIIGTLNSINVKPTLLIYPKSKLYISLVGDDLERQFIEAIKDMSAHLDFDYKDYTKDIRFDDSHFWDQSHLNVKGASLMTKIISQEIIRG